MGNHYTKEEKLEFEKYKVTLDKAFYEKDRYVIFKQIRKSINKDLLENRK